MKSALIIYEGDNDIVDNPYVYGDNVIVPNGWYILNSNLDNRPESLFYKDKILKVKDHVQISYNNNVISVIKVNDKLDVNDMVKYLD
jgi:hypothetical protein